MAISGKPCGRTRHLPAVTPHEETAEVEWPSRAACDAAAAKMQADERMQSMPEVLPFDPARLVYGGFTPVVELGE